MRIRWSCDHYAVSVGIYVTPAGKFVEGCGERGKDRRGGCLGLGFIFPVS